VISNPEELKLYNEAMIVKTDPNNPPQVKKSTVEKIKESVFGKLYKSDKEESIESE
jgi:hypothetical protein